MSDGSSSARRDPGYVGLTQAIGALPASYYYDPAHYQRELTRIWYRNWIYVCRSRAIAEPRSFRTLELGDQSILVVRGEDRIARAFHNTCRHRGAALCRTAEGRFPAAGIVCPYHSWRYNLRGELVQTSSLAAGDGFELQDFPSLRPSGDRVERLRVRRAHAQSAALRCELRPAAQPPRRLAAPRARRGAHAVQDDRVQLEGVLGKLQRVPALPGRASAARATGADLRPALLERRDDPSWQDHADDDDPKYAGGLRLGAESWSMDGKPVGVPFPKVSSEDRKAGHVYMTSVPSVFMVAHVDYVRVVRLRPLGPERTHMSIEFLFLPETLTDPRRNLTSAVEFTDIVMSEDAGICELNQRGLHALPHARGVLMPEEYALRQFHDWVRSELARA